MAKRKWYRNVSTNNGGKSFGCAKCIDSNKTMSSIVSDKNLFKN